MRIKLRKFKSVKSTNNTAIRIIKSKNFKPMMITTEKQIKGKGRMGKKWVSKKGNLFVSIFFKIDLKKINLKNYSLLNALLIRKILQKYIFHKIDVKLPNDLLINRKKVCRILQEIIQVEKKLFLIVGIGINTNSHPKLSDYETTSLKCFLNKKVDNNVLLKDIKLIYEKFVDDIHKYSFAQLKEKIG